MSLRRLLVPALLSVAATSAIAQDHSHMAAGKLGTVHFATSCSASVTPTFDHGIALLHSFEFGDAIKSFNEVLASDSSCTMAAWGLALSRWTNPMSTSIRTPAQLNAGRQSALLATRLGERATPREKAYANAVNALYADFEHASQRDRIVGYERAMAGVVSAFPADTEAMIFHAIALVAAAP